MSQYDWYAEFFKRKVLPGLLREMLGCSGSLQGDHADFLIWLKESDRPLYDEMTFQDEKLCEIWMKQGNRESFKEACRAFVFALLKAKPAYLAAMAEPQRPLL